MTAYCIKCKTETVHAHMHDCAHGIPETHMDGSERYVCQSCGHFIKPDDNKLPAKAWWYDKPSKRMGAS